MKRQAVLCLFALGTLGCDDPPFCDVCTTSAIVYGTVVDSEGAAVVGTRVDVAVGR